MDDRDEAFRQACEARYVAGMTDDERTAFYATVLAKRGKAAANRLIEAVNAERRARHPGSQAGLFGS